MGKEEEDTYHASRRQVRSFGGHCSRINPWISAGKELKREKVDIVSEVSNSFGCVSFVFPPIVSRNSDFSRGKLCVYR